MSREVDQRVVEMQFNNVQFERNTKQSINTIERLKASLDFDGVSNSFAGITKAAKNVNLEPVSDGANEVYYRFKALDVVAGTVLSNITAKAMTLGWTLTKALTIDPMKSGLAEYETQINSVQTILANTQKEGTNLAQVNAALDELNHYADMTIYNFTEMTRNIGTFTAAGVKLDTSVQAIKGIANLAAVSGSTSMQASTAMYQLSQALAAGTVKLMDWNSVVNAGMGGQVFQDALKETARVHGVAIDEMIAKEGSFRETLQHGWLTASILTETLAKFTGDLSEEELRAIGYTEDQIAAIIKMGETANDAATKVKTFTQLIDTLKEAVQSGWTQSWEYIIGDFEEAKELWTEISDRLQAVIGQSSEARNSLLKGVFTSGWNQLIDLGITDSASLLQDVLVNLGKEAGVLSDAQIEAAGSFEESLKGGWLTAELIQNGLNNIIDQFDELLKLSDKEISSFGYSRKEIIELENTYKSLNEEIAKGNVNLDSLAERMKLPSTGRDNLISSLFNVFDAIGSLIEPIKKSFENIFPKITIEQLYDFTEQIEEFTKKLIISEETASKLERVFNGVFSIFKFGSNTIESLFGYFGQFLNSVSPLVSSFLGLAASIGDLVSSFISLIDEIGIFNGVITGFESILTFASNGFSALSKSLDEFSNKTSVVINPLEFIYGCLKDFVEFISPGLIYFGTVSSEAFGEFSKSAINAFNSFDPTNLYNFMNAGMGLGILTSIKNFVDSGKNIFKGASSFVDGIKNILNELGKSITTWRTNKNSETLMTVSKSIGILAASLTVLSLIKPERLTASIASITVLFGELMGAFYILGKIDIKNGVKLTALSVSMLSFASSVLILSSALTVISSIDTDKLIGSILTLGAVLIEFIASTVILSSSTKRMTKGLTGMLAMATSVRILASSVSMFADIDSGSLIKGILALGAVLLELGAFSIIVGKLGNGFGILKGISFGILAGSMLVLSNVVKTFGDMDVESLQKGVLTLGAILLELGTFSVLMGHSTGIISSSAAMVILSVALNLLVSPFKELGELSLENIGKGLLSIGGAIAIFAAASMLMQGNVLASFSILAMAAAMIPLAKSFSMISELDPWNIVKSLLAIAGAFTVFGVAGYVLAPVAPVIVALSLALGVFAAAIGGLLVAASSANLINNLAGSLALLSTLNFSAFLQAIQNVAWMVVEFIAGIIKGIGEIAATLVTSIAEIITAICEAIINAAPAIGEAVSVLIIELCEVIRETAPEIAYTVIYLIGQLWEAIKPALVQLWNNITGWVDENIIHHDWFGIGAMINDFKDIWFGDAEKAGKNTAEGYVSGIEAEEPNLLDRIASLGSKVAATWNRFWGIQSPSKLAQESGNYIAEGYSEGLLDGETIVGNGMYALAEAVNDAFCEFWGIHSPSDLAASNAENIALGMIQGMTNKTEAAKKAAEYLATHTLDGLYTDNYAESAYAAGLTLGLEYQRGLDDGTSGDELQNWLSEKFKKPEENENGNDGENNTTIKPSSSSTKKTPSEIIEDKYKDQLEANKTLKEIADAEYELWMTENQNGAAADEILAKNLEHVSENIELQTKRVELAQAKYNEIVKTVGADAKEAKEAYSSLLDEKNTLASLKAEQYTDLYDDIINRLSVESDRLNKEYELWGSENPGASDFEKTTREIQNVTDQLSVNAEELKYAEQQYQVLLEEYGESDLRTQEAYNEWLDARIEVQDKQNELLEKQLEQFDNAITAIERQSSLYQAKTDLLASVYDDGDLSTRAEDYVSAVETYGKNSPEALRARYQGSSSAVLGVAVAMRNMADQMKKTSVYMDRYQALLDSGTASAEELAQAQEDILSSQASFVGFAENLADAFDMDEAGKEITVKLAYAISNNWDTIYGGFKKVWSKIDEKFPELASNLSKVFGDAFSEEGAEIATSLVSTVTNALSGDYGSAIVDGLNTILSFVGSDMGKNIISSLGSVLTEGIPEIGTMLSSLFGSGGGGGILGEIGLAIGSLIETIGGSGGLAGIVETIGTALAGIGLSIPELLPLIAIILAVGAAIAFLISNWEEVGEFLSNLIDNIVEFGKNLVEGFVNGIKKAWEGITNFIGVLFGGIIDFVKGIFGINSPSKEFFALGEYIDQGFADGIAASAGSVSKSISDMTSSALTTADMMSSKLASTLSAGGNYSYAIEPVVDLSDLEDSRNWLTSSLSGLNVSNSLDTSRSARLASDTALRQNQNGKEITDSTRADVVAAIGTLSDRVVMMGRSIEGMQVVLDSKKLVGGISGQMDSALGVRAARARRGG